MTHPGYPGHHQTGPTLYPLHQAGRYPPPGWVPPQPPKKRKWPWVVGGIFGFIILVSAVGGNNSSTPSPTTARSAIPTVQQAPAAVEAPAAEQLVEPVPEQSGPMTQFADVETLAVGTDIAPGQYTTSGAPGGFMKSNCYYEIHRSESGTFSDLVKNGNIGENSKGRVTLKKGQYFSSHGGCTWTKAG